MAMKKRGKVSWATEGWDVQTEGTVRGPRRGAAVEDPFAAKLAATNRWEVEQTLTATPKLRRGEAAPTPLTLDVEGRADEVYVVMTRYASGAIRFHFPSEPARRGTRRGGRVVHHFSIPVPAQTDAGTGRRGFISAAIKTVVLKIAGAVADFVLPKLAYLWETAAWKIAGRREGWLSVDSAGLGSKEVLPAADLSTLSTSDRNLLFLHGTFSNTKSAFKGLGSTQGADGQTFFENLREVYGNRIYGFDHFTVSRTPEDNVKMLLEALPNRPTAFDVVTHSRGGLVLRHLVERRELFPGLADRFAVGRVVLVASPNEGTPLASPDHVSTYTNWLSNVLELFPDNPFTTGLEFVSEALSWIARRIGGGLPGLASMDSKGEIIRALQSPPGPPAEAYSALVANYEPDDKVLQRIVDAGADLFFQTANDLVVPTEGGWRVDRATGVAIPGDRVGCFGLGGNLVQQHPVNHVNFSRTRPRWIFSSVPCVDRLNRRRRWTSRPTCPLAGAEGWEEPRRPPRPASSLDRRRRLFPATRARLLRLQPRSLGRLNRRTCFRSR